MYLFVFFVLFILLSTHFFVLYFLMVSFSLFNYKLIFIIIGFLLSGSFILASIFSHLFNNSISRGFYYISSSWLGILSNLVFSIALICILLIIFRFFNLNLNLKIFSSIAIIISFSVSFYGIYNANNPIIKNVDISIKNLPESWKNKKIIFISDIHIGAIIREKFFQKITNLINSQNPDLVLITGDLFDGTDGELDHMTKYIDEINARQGIYYVNGNHEIYLGNNITKSLLEKTKIKILDDKIQNIDGVQLIGVSYIESRFGGENISQKLQKLKPFFDKTIPSILLYHAPVYTKDFSNFGINLQLSGHTHKGQIWPFGYITNLIYKGKDYGLVTEGNYNIYTTNGVGTWGPPMRVGNTPEIVVLNLK